MEAAAAGWSDGPARRPPQALLLGATPQIASMRWPQGTTLIAADHSLPLIEAIWPGNTPSRQIAGAEWTELPLPDGCCDIAIGDGSLACVRYPDGMRAVASEVRRVLRQGGKFITRVYLRREVSEHKEDLVEELLRGEIPSFHWFKFRLLMAMQESVEQGVAVEDVYRYWVSLKIDAQALSERTGWDANGIRMIELYRDANTVYAFPTLHEMRALLSEHFGEITISMPSPVMGDRCPILEALPRPVAPEVSRDTGAVECVG